LSRDGLSAFRGEHIDVEGVSTLSIARDRCTHAFFGGRALAVDKVLECPDGPITTNDFSIGNTYGSEEDVGVERAAAVINEEVEDALNFLRMAKQL